MDKTAQQPAGVTLAQNVSQQLSARKAAVENLNRGELSDRRAHTQATLLAAGRHLIAEKGVAGASVGDITKACGFTRGAFYSNFTDMDHFVAEVAQLEWQAMFQDVQEILSHWSFSSSDPIEGATRVLLAALPRDRERYLLWNEFSTFEIRFPQSSHELSRSSQNFYAGLVDILALVLETFDLEPLHDPEDLTELIVSLAHRSIRNELISGSDASHDSATKSVSDQAEVTRSSTAARHSQPNGRESTLLARMLPPLVRSLTQPRTSD